MGRCADDSPHRVTSPLVVVCSTLVILCLSLCGIGVKAANLCDLLPPGQSCMDETGFELRTLQTIWDKYHAFGGSRPHLVGKLLKCSEEVCYGVHTTFCVSSFTFTSYLRTTGLNVLNFQMAQTSGLLWQRLTGNQCMTLLQPFPTSYQRSTMMIGCIHVIIGLPPSNITTLAW